MAAAEGKIPSHVGIIMDGNGRWAEARGERRTAGHLAGLETAKHIVKAAAGMGLQYLTLYAFSTENWKRAGEEVHFIMGLVKQYLRSELDFYRENRIRLRYAGDKSGLARDIAEEIALTCEETGVYGGLQVILALNYGGRDEIVRALRRAALAGLDLAALTEAELGKFLDNPDIPDPDLIIRSAGEFRISNFLLWEGAYAEYYISPRLWPDWTEEDLRLALESYEKRERKFGGLRE
ncbi:MAG: di-trans,poly-cis-decaprenylcistransferase [Treponema sp.]|jgi:undecaprenyl diphosphate synthase|nr:di-trans,poly-cis-decaprenylcistransferase [Treponema sp.]